ncbi:hypothetical protein [Pseudorhodoplanes sinuspersici]|uniref:Uncharacterized protein n=1 Tax=Pseudorhodoplanes sinuspersici TaxID=1235591 RepID=A0A1W6ZLK7_9HYPH|nr:hypothetical protein [Pseudorhodoplanes sinuspersici]ARP98239.1 hypothetical protein CAK95_03395 [Pseudorhodoplanes sinuspersici]RKE68004.1 hypothetical protein DFP91_4358 [Pseudorhodoplanes sinuspersici]
MSRARNQPDPRHGLPKTITVTVPMRFERRGGRKTILSPVTHAPPPPKYDNALVKAIARAHRWRRLIETGEYSSITELAKAEKINQSYACRLFRLTLLAPDIVEQILNGKQKNKLQLRRLLRPLPAEWARQNCELSD